MDPEGFDPSTTCLRSRYATNYTTGPWQNLDAIYWAIFLSLASKVHEVPSHYPANSGLTCMTQLI